MRENNFTKNLRRLLVLLVFAMFCRTTFAQNTTFGDGSQGSLTVSTSQVINNYYEIIAANQYSSSVRVNATGLSGGNYLLMQMTGTNAGIWEFIDVYSTSGQFLLLPPSSQVTQQFTVNATSKAQAIKVPNYSDVTINNGGVLTCLPYNPNTGIGGILVFKANGTFTINFGGRCDVSSNGFPANTAGTATIGGVGGAGGNATNIHAALASIPNTGLNGGGNGGLQMNNASSGNVAVIPAYPGVATTASNATVPITNPTHPNLYLGACGLSGNSGNSGKGAGGGGAGVGANPCNNGQDGESGGNGGAGGLGGAGGGLIMIFASTTDIHGNGALVANGGNGSVGQNGSSGGKGGNGANGCGSCIVGGAGGGGNGANGGNGGNGGSGGASGFIYIKKSAGTTLNSTICQLLGGNGASGGNGGIGGVAGLNATLVGTVSNCPNNSSGGGPSGTPTNIPVNSTCNLTAVMNALATIGTGAYSTQNISTTVTEYSLGGNTVTIDATNNNRAIVIAVVNGLTYHAVIDITNATVSILTVLQNVLNGNTLNANWNGNDLNFINGSALASCDVLPTRNTPVDGNAGSGGSGGGSGGNGDFYEDIVPTCTDASTSFTNVYNVCCFSGGGFDCSTAANDFFNLQSDPPVGTPTDIDMGGGTTIYTISSSQGCTYTFQCTNVGDNQTVDVVVTSITNPSSTLTNDGSVYISSLASFAFGPSCGTGAFHLNDASGNTIADLNSFPSGTVTGLAPGTYTAYPDGCGSMGAPFVFTLAAPSCQNTTSTTTISICASALPYHWNGNVYNTAGSYTVHLNNAGGCDSAATLNLTVKSNTSSTTNTSICASALPYSWNGQSYTNAGSYTIHLTNLIGCDSVATLNLTVSSAVISQTINLSGCNNVLYNSNNYNTSTTLHETLQNIYGCDSVYKTINITVNANPVLQIQIPVDSCATSSTTIATTTSYSTYNWTLPNGSILNTSTIVGSQAGSYQLTVTNAQGCSTTASFALYNCLPPSIVIDGDSVLCGTEGTREFTASIAGYPTATFEWTDPFGGTSTSNPIVVNNGSVGLYTVVATLPNGSTIAKTINISSATAITYSVLGQNLCSGATVGSFDVTTTGGTAPYTYNWTNNVTSATNTNEDQLNVPYNQDFYGTITDANGCSTGANLYFQVQSPIAVFVNGTTLPCGATSGNVTVSATGGLPFYDASGNPYYLGTGVLNLSVGSHTIFVKDSIGCVTSTTFTITAPCVCSIPQVSIASDYNQSGIRSGKIYYCYGGALTLTGSLINSASYSWTGPNGFTATTRTIQINPAKPIHSGRYTVVASLSSTCFSTGYVDVVVLPQLVVTTSLSISVCPNTPVTLSATASATPVTFYWTYNFATVNPTTFIATNANQGVYLVKAVDAYGCSGSSSLKVNLLPVPNPVITGPTQVCVGSTIHLTATPTGGVWASLNNRASINSTAGVLTGLAGGGVASVRYTVTNSSGCTAFTNYNVTVNSLPAVPSIAYAPGTPNPQTGAGGGSNFCRNRTFTVVGTPGGGVWSSTGVMSVTNPAGVASTGSVVGAGSLIYTVTVNGCSNSRTISGNVVVCAFRGVNGGMASGEQLVASSDFTMYPNPAKTFISLSVNSLIGAGIILVTDLYGKQVKKQSLSIGTNTVDVSSFAKGIYFVSMITNEGKVTKKLVVE